MDAATLSVEDRRALDGMTTDLRRVFGARLETLAAYGLDAAGSEELHTLALVERLEFADLAACVPLAAGWHRAGLAVPLILEHDEFLRSLDVFPLEYGAIIAHHVIVAGSDPFRTARVSPADVRRACELAAKSHLIHLREGFLESQGNPRSIVRLIATSAGPFRALLSNIARLSDAPATDVGSFAEQQIGIPATLVADVFAAAAGAHGTIVDPTALLARYISAVERIWEYVDDWRQR